MSNAHDHNEAYDSIASMSHVRDGQEALQAAALLHTGTIQTSLHPPENAGTNGKHIQLQSLGRNRDDHMSSDLSEDIHAEDNLDIESSQHGDEAPLLSNYEHPQPINGVASTEPKHTWSHRRKKETNTSREVLLFSKQKHRYPANLVSNAKYSPWSFLPLTLYNEFSFFFNLYFLLVALSQILPALRIGYLSTYIAPLAFVLSITLGKEAVDDISRRRRDAEANKEEYTMLEYSENGRQASRNSQRSRQTRSSSGRRIYERVDGDRVDMVREEEEFIGQELPPPSSVRERLVKSRDIKVGDILKLDKDQRVPADLIVLKSFSNDDVSKAMAASGAAEGNSGQPSQTKAEEPEQQNSGEAFLRTDQLDGETDWKLRFAPPLTQTLLTEAFDRVHIFAGPPSSKVNEFNGTVELLQQKRDNTIGQTGSTGVVSSPLSVDNTAWANTVLASHATVLGVVIFTGPDTRQAMSSSPSRSKSGLLEYEINNLTKILCALTLALSLILVAIRGAEGRPGQEWYVATLRYLVLFSTIVPISLRVNLDMGKTVYARFIERDRDIPETVVRTSTIPEELGRIEYLLSDKTGTLTQNEMDLRKVHVGTVSYANEAMDEVRSFVRQVLHAEDGTDGPKPRGLITPSTQLLVSGNIGSTRGRREIGSRVRDLVMALALCHNVTPATEVVDSRTITTYQASSPDEIAIVRWVESVGLRLLHRDRKSITLQSTDTEQVVVRVKILEIFPFSSASKRMGIIVKFTSDGAGVLVGGAEEIWFYEKGADTVMGSIVATNDWLDEETANMAREGLRTLVIGRKRLSPKQHEEFAVRYKQASMSLQYRDENVAQVVKDDLENNLELLGVTGVEDKLQRDVKPSLELLRNAGVKIWMLTGDKVETARCVAISSKLVGRNQHIHAVTQITNSRNPSAASDALSLLRSKSDTTALLIDGDSLSYFLANHKSDFISAAVNLPAVIACRCSPTQKADIAYLIRDHTKKRVASIGDGGNDVPMIQAADVGLGIVGKEGRQASLAADFSITSFHHLTKLLVWHGRNSYKRSAKLAQFVIHRGLIIAVCQTVYSIAAQFQPHALYRDWLLVGYATVYTMAPVFSLVLDRDVDEGVANLYPELYKELKSGKSLSYNTFFIWVAVSIYQGSIIQLLSQLLVNRDSPRMVSVSYTVLIFNELIMVAFEIVTWHWIMATSIVGTAVFYVGSLPFLGDYYDLAYMWSWAFVWRAAAISALSLIPPYAVKILRRTLSPPNYRKVQGL